MYGFPTQSVQETVDSLEVVRQLFMNGLIQSGFWHQFALTAHSPIGLSPEPFKINIKNPLPGMFANNDLEYTDLTGCNHEQFSEGLARSLFNYMNGIGFDFPLQDWFDFRIPLTTIPPNYIERAINDISNAETNPNAAVFWTGKAPKMKVISRNKRGIQTEIAEITLQTKKHETTIQVSLKTGRWLMDVLPRTSIYKKETTTFQQLEQDYSQTVGSDFKESWNSKAFRCLKETGLITV
ncbi:MAG TPA: radical SAM protein, partial [Bacteroidales bacterium]|nr:radical SAM protein [Bacteroidales bacterium]